MFHNGLERTHTHTFLLYYDGDAKLVRYQGFSNLKPPAGQSREVQIDFRHYESEQSLDSPLAEWLPGAQRG